MVANILLQKRLVCCYLKLCFYWNTTVVRYGVVCLSVSVCVCVRVINVVFLRIFNIESTIDNISPCLASGYIGKICSNHIH